MKRWTLLSALAILTAGVHGEEIVPAKLGPYLTKSVIESPTKVVVRNATKVAPVPTGDTFVNPKVTPGKVNWHTSLADACAAARKSGKPVLLFQMMGKLDDKFC
jgi:hypothetical protein